MALKPYIRFGLILFCICISERAQAYVLLGDTAWCDDFESYTVGANTSPNWHFSDPGQKKDNVVVNDFAANGSQSVKLFGTVGGCFGTIIARSLETSFPLRISLAIRNGTESITGCHPFRGEVELMAGAPWNSPSVSLLRFLQDGSAIATLSNDSAMLSPYPLEQWHDVEILLWFSGDTLHGNYFINGAPVGSFFRDSSTTPYIRDLTHLGLIAQEGTVWFDDVCISTMPLSDTISLTSNQTCLTCPVTISAIGSFSQPIAGANVPLSFDTSALFVDSVTFVDTCVSGWNLNIINISNDSGFLQVGLLNTTLDVIPPGVCTLFTVFATPKTDSWPSGDCASAQLVFNVGPIDTALSGDPSRQLLLTDSNFNDIVPVFIKTDSVLVHNFIPGDATGNGKLFNIGDVVFLINRIFGGGAAPCPECAGDADGSGTFNIADVTYLIARIFSGGPGPVCPIKCLNP